MEQLIWYIDRITMWAGKGFAWAILVMTFGVGYEVFVRYLLRDPTSWAFDISYMMYGTLFMMAGAYTLSRDGHVRGDFIYRLWRPRIQATVELVLYFLFFFPGVLALTFAGWKYASRSWSYNNGWGEVSVMSPANVPISHFKTIISIAGALLLIQGIAQVCRCIVCLRTGAWPKQEEDVEELERHLLQERETAELKHYTEAVDVLPPEASPPALLERAREGGADDLKEIPGIGPELEAALNRLGVYHYDQIATWREDHIAWIDARLKLKGQIERGGWIRQAEALMGGKAAPAKRPRKAAKRSKSNGSGGGRRGGRADG